MRTILAICLLTASFAFIPNASAGCDPTGTACSFGDGDCTNGYAYNYVNAAGAVVVMTDCGGYPGYYSYSGIYVITPVGDHYWVGYNFFGFEGCYSDSYNVAGYTETPFCDVAGAPPGVPALIP